MNGSRRAIYELLGLALAVAACMALAAACRLSLAAKARDVYATDAGMAAVQSVADALSESRGDMGRLESLFPDGVPGDGMFTVCFDACMSPVHKGFGDAAYSVTARAPERNGFLGTCRVELLDADGKVLWGITASWQEDAP